jgi:hypothetical protein
VSRKESTKQLWYALSRSDPFCRSKTAPVCPLPSSAAQGIHVHSTIVELVTSSNQSLSQQGYGNNIDLMFQQIGI